MCGDCNPSLPQTESNTQIRVDFSVGLVEKGKGRVNEALETSTRLFEYPDILWECDVLRTGNYIDIPWTRANLRVIESMSRLSAEELKACISRKETMSTLKRQLADPTPVSVMYATLDGKRHYYPNDTSEVASGDLPSLVRFKTSIENLRNIDLFDLRPWNTYLVTRNCIRVAEADISFLGISDVGMEETGGDSSTTYDKYGVQGCVGI